MSDQVHKDNIRAPPGYHDCPQCGHRFPCDKRQTGRGRIGRPVRIGPNHYSILAILQEKPTNWFTPREIQYLLSDRQIVRVGKRTGWSIAAVTDTISDLLGKGYIEANRPKRGREWLYRFKKALDVPLGTVIP
jgi:hypothetical protein